MRSQTLFASRPPGLFGNRVSRMLPGHGGTIHTLGWTLTTYGTVGHALVAGSRRTTFVSGGATARGFHTSSPQCWLGDDAGFGGFSLSIRFALGADLASTRAFVGLSAETGAAVAAGQPTAIANSIGVGLDSTESSWRAIRSEGGAGRSNALITGASRNTDLLDLAICSRPYSAEGRAVMMRLTNLTTGTILLGDTLYKEADGYLPDAGALLLVHAGVYHPTSATLTLDVSQAALEIPDGARHTPVLLGRAGHYDVREFGARGDATTADDSAFALAMSAMGPVDNHIDREGSLYAPPGTFKLTGHLELERSLRFHGAGPAGRCNSEGPSKLEFAAKKGIRTYGHECSPNDGDATYVIVEDLQIEGSDDATPVDVWQAATPYAQGAHVRSDAARGPGQAFDYYMEQVRPGTRTSGGTEPAFGDLNAIDPTTQWAPNTAYLVDNAVHASARFDVFFVCTASGTSDLFTEPTWTATPGGTTFDPPPAGPPRWQTKTTGGYFLPDGGMLGAPTGPVWACKVSSGIYAQSIVTLRRLGIRKFLNAGITVQANSLGTVNAIIQGSNANSFVVNDVHVSKCGVGMLVRGGETNQGVSTCVQVKPLPADDGKACGIDESSFLGGRLIACRVETCDGPAILCVQAASSGSAYGCSADSDSDAVVTLTSQPYGFFGNTFAGGLAPVNGALGALAADDWQEVKSLFTPLGEEERLAQYYGQVSVALFEATGDGFYACTRADGFAPGWFHLPYTNVMYGSYLMAYSTENAVGFEDRGPGYLWTPNGILVGATRSIVTFADAKPTMGTWRRGDIVFNSQPATDAPSYWQCVDDAPLEFRDGPTLGMQLNGWWRADYVGSPWEGNPSGGTSGSNDLSAATPPSQGLAQNAFVPADFDGTNDLLASAAHIEDLISLSAYTAVVLFYADTADAAAPNVEDDTALLTDTWPGWAVTFSAGGFGIAHYDSGTATWKTQRVPCGTGAYHIGQITYDGTDVKIRIDSEAWTTIAGVGNLAHAAATYTLAVGQNYLGAYFDGRILEIMLAPTAFSDARLDAVVAYLTARYALAVGETLTGWWRADYGGQPWLGEPSTGPSGARDLTGANDPDVGPQQGGFFPAEFVPANSDHLDAPLYIEDYISLSAYSAIVLFAADGAAAAAPDVQDDPALLSDTLPGWALTFSDEGLGIAHYDSVAVAWQQLRVPCTTGTYHVGQVVYDGAEIRIRVDSEAWQTIPNVGDLGMAAATYTLVVGKSQLPAYFEGRVLEIMLAPAALSDATFDNIVGYLNARYALSLNLALTAWWRADYAGSPWLGTVSGGPSGGRNLADIAQAPATGTAVNGLTPADFNGTTDTMSSPLFIESYIDPAAYSVIILFNADTAAAAAGNVEDDPALLTDSWPGWAVTFSTGGFGVAHYDGAWKGTRVTCATMGWHAGQIVYDGAEIRIRVDSGAWTTVATVGNLAHAANSYYLIAGKSWVPGYFDGSILEIMLAPEALSDAKFDAIIDYLNGRYALAL